MLAIALIFLGVLGVVLALTYALVRAADKIDGEIADHERELKREDDNRDVV